MKRLQDNAFQNQQQSSSASSKAGQATGQSQVERLKYLQSVLDDLGEKGFVSREKMSIHDEKSILFYKEILKVDDWVINTLEKGLNIDLKWPIYYYVEVNNKSARQNMPVLRKEVDKWIEEGKVSRLTSAPSIINPMSFVSKTLEDGSQKVRPVIDMSRRVNLAIPDYPVKLQDLDWFEPMFEQGQFATIFDLRGMFHQLKLHPKARELFGFQLPHPSKPEMEYFTFEVLQFGCKPAVFYMDRLMKPVMNYLRGLGLKIGLYIDDGMLVNLDRQVLELETKLTMAVLNMAGWEINWEKTQLIPQQIVQYQGFLIDFQQGKYFYPEQKLEKVNQLAIDILVKGEMKKRQPAEKLASFLGKVCASRRSHGRSVQIGLRHTQHLLGRSVMHRGVDQEPDWLVQVSLDGQSIEEIRQVRSILMTRNGQRWKYPQEFEIASTAGFRLKIKEEYADPDQVFDVFVSDASDTQVFIYEASKFKIVEDFGFSEEEKKYGSGRRELLAVLKMLEHRKLEVSEGCKRVYWVTDSQNLFHFLRRGSRRQDIQKDVMKVKKFEQELGIEIIPVWEPRSTLPIVLADLGSKTHLSTDEWGIDQKTFLKIQSRFGITFSVDGFALSSNTKCQKFFSKIPQVGSAGVNFFAQILSSSEYYYLTPPVSLVLPTIKHILAQQDRVVAVVSFPAWKNTNYYSSVIQGNQWAPYVMEAFFTSPVYVPGNQASTVFSGRKQFRFVSILINNKILDNEKPFF